MKLSQWSGERRTKRFSRSSWVEGGRGEWEGPIASGKMPFALTQKFIWISEEKRPALILEIRDANAVKNDMTSDKGGANKETPVEK